MIAFFYFPFIPRVSYKKNKLTLKFELSPYMKKIPMNGVVYLVTKKIHVKV